MMRKSDELNFLLILSYATITPSHWSHVSTDPCATCEQNKELHYKESSCIVPAAEPSVVGIQNWTFVWSKRIIWTDLIGCNKIVFAFFSLQPHLIPFYLKPHWWVLLLPKLSQPFYAHFDGDLTSSGKPPVLGCQLSQPRWASTLL